MLQFAAIFLAQMTPLALAEEPYERAKPWRYEKYLGSIDEVIHNGPTEVPLYNNFSGRPGSLTALPFEDADGETREWLTVFTSSLPYIIVSNDFAQYMGATVKTTNKKLIPIWKEYKLGGQIDYAIFDELTIGNMTLRNVTALIRDYEKGTDYIESFDNNVHILIGFNQLESAYQVLPSEGTIKFEGTADGSALMSEYGNAVGYQNYTGGKYTFFKSDILINSGTLMLDVNVDGEPQKLLLETARFGTVSNIKEGTGTHHLNDHDTKYSSFEFGSFKGDTFTASFSFDWKVVPHDGVIGLDLLNNYDIAVDVGNQQVAFRPLQSDQKRLSFVPTQLAQAQAKIDEKLNAEPSEEGEEAPEPTAKDWQELMNFQLQMGQLEAAYESALKRTELEPENCLFWLTASDLALTLNKVEDAKSHAQKSSDFYHKWWSIPLENRQEIQKIQDKMSEEEQEQAKEDERANTNPEDSFWHFSQSGSCHEADSQLAWTLIANDELEKVLPLYRDKIDLDEKLAMATAYSAILQNNLPLAQETLRQALKLGKGYSSIAEAALALWYADIGDTEQFERLMFSTQTNDVLYHALEIDNYRQIHGSEKTIAFLEARLKKAPMSTTYNYLYVRELKLAEAGAAYDDAVAKADKVFQTDILNLITAGQPLTNIEHNGLSYYASYLILTDRIEEAEGIINNQLNKVQFGHGYIALTMANYYSYKGDMDSAMAELAKLKLDGRSIISLSSAFLLRPPASASAE